jgi:threonine-phosphate decarboxylase
MAREAVKEALELVGYYPDPEARLLKEALAAYHGLSQNRILPANGSTELIYLVPRVFAPKRALVVEPAFSEYRASLVSSGCRVES